MKNIEDLLREENNQLKEFVKTVADAPIEYHTYRDYYDRDKDAEHIDVEYKNEAMELFKKLYPEETI